MKTWMRKKYNWFLMRKAKGIPIIKEAPEVLTVMKRKMMHQDVGKVREYNARNNEDDESHAIINKYVNLITMDNRYNKFIFILMDELKKIIEC